MKNMGNNKNKAPSKEDYIRMLSCLNHLTEPAIRAAIKELKLTPGSNGLDAGCGIGIHTQWLADAVSPNGKVTGMDISPDHLSYAKENIKQTGLAERVSFQQGDLNKLPFEDNSFDWAWSCDALWAGSKEMGCPAEDTLPLVKELARVVKKGGLVAVLFWSSQKLLPGYPLLEARLYAGYEANSAYIGVRPELQSLRTLSLLQAAGIKDNTARTFAADAKAPFSDIIRGALITSFQMFFGGAQSSVSDKDWSEFKRLCQPDSADLILNHPGYYAFLTYTLFYGKVNK